MQATECLVHLEAVYGAGAGGGRGVRGDACVASVSGVKSVRDLKRWPTRCGVALRPLMAS